MANWNGAVASREEVRELKRRAAVRVAAKIFNAKGYHATSLDEIADEIGVTKTALYYYFKNKEQLLFECLKLTYHCGEVAQQEAEAMDGTAYEKLRHLYKRFMEILLEERGVYTTMSNIRALPEHQQDDLLSKRKELDRYARGLLDQAINDGTVRNIDPRLTSNFFLGSVNWILRWHTEDGENLMTSAETADHFLDLFMNGIAEQV
ncbi:TetR/AcrR family transcriptional regulator [Pseudooceanicola sp. MF1-13]|uniref:TetR/AcrR family transcriptional regulator n=1 Tax=Pseudooceanicola sp. MF1-13 TaxID=3379095 RepID=UPI003892A8EB